MGQNDLIRIYYFYIIDSLYMKFIMLVVTWCVLEVIAASNNLVGGVLVWEQLRENDTHFPIQQIEIAYMKENF